jgi:hypothetical protein
MAEIIEKCPKSGQHEWSHFCNKYVTTRQCTKCGKKQRSMPCYYWDSMGIYPLPDKETKE